jgi:hypothetical protein
MNKYKNPSKIQSSPRNATSANKNILAMPILSRVIYLGTHCFLALFIILIMFTKSLLPNITPSLAYKCLIDMVIDTSSIAIMASTRQILPRCLDTYSL